MNMLARVICFVKWLFSVESDCAKRQTTGDVLSKRCVEYVRRQNQPMRYEDLVY